jgi:hypothetical protein
LIYRFCDATTLGVRGDSINAINAIKLRPADAIEDATTLRFDRKTKHKRS